MVVEITGLKLSLEEGEDKLKEKVASLFAVPLGKVRTLKIIKKSLDARRCHGKPCFVYVLEVEMELDVPPAMARKERGVLIIREKEVARPSREALPHRGKPSAKVVVVGSGPAGLFAAFFLVRLGVPVMLLERGKPVQERIKDVRLFWEEGILNRESNVLFGEGGAGTFSDGKLTSRVKDERAFLVKEVFVNLGAPPEILYEAKPHIGTDVLSGVVANFRKQLEAWGCEIRFGARVSDFVIRDGRIKELIVNEQEEIEAPWVILATGQNAEDTYGILAQKGVAMVPKAFALGLRVEHPQEIINKGRYGKWWRHPKLPPAEYFLTAKVGNGRSLYTFCMCPGGSIIGCSADPGRVVVNGMSLSKRDGPLANCALVVNVHPEDFMKNGNALLGLDFRRIWEEKAFQLGGGGFYAPAQRLTDFLREKISATLPTSSFLPGVRSAPLKEVLPPFVFFALKEGIPVFGKKMPGFITAEALLVGVETRTSSPLRLLRGEDGQSVNVRGLFPCGEGAGYAGGIISSAVDGLKAAQRLLLAMDGHR